MDHTAIPLCATYICNIKMTCIHRTYTISSLFMKQRTISHFSRTKLHHVIRHIMEPQPKLLAYKNIVPGQVFMLEDENWSYNYTKTSQVSVPQCKTRFIHKPQSQSQVHSKDHTIESWFTNLIIYLSQLQLVWLIMQHYHTYTYYNEKRTNIH